MMDWKSLEEQLRALGVQIGKEKKISSTRLSRHPIEKVVPGRFLNLIYGEVFCHEEGYPHAHVHGTKPLSP